MRSLKTLFGESKIVRRVSDFSLSERAYAPGFKTPAHAHDKALFCLVLQGGYTERQAGTSLACAPNSVLFHAPGESHAEHFHDQGGRSFIVEIDPAWLEGVRRQAPIPDRSAHVRDGLSAFLGMNLYREMYATDQVSPVVVEGLMLTLLGETTRRTLSLPVGSKHPPPWLEQAKQLLHDEFDEPLTLAEIALRVGVHPVHLAQSFQRHFRSTVGDYLRRLRIEYSARELAASNRPLAEIALAAGFADQSHFSRMFKRHNRMSPAEYRATFRRSEEDSPRRHRDTETS